MDAKTVTDLLHSCGGVVVLAHPGQYKADNVMEMMIEEHMLDGIELNHPRNDEKTREQANKAFYEKHPKFKK
jgi:predicted metal-dependent phosphoesterase TrpH